jgi:hypothetical protein
MNSSALGSLLDNVRPSLGPLSSAIWSVHWSKSKNCWYYFNKNETDSSKKSYCIGRDQAPGWALDPQLNEINLDPAPVPAPTPAPVPALDLAPAPASTSAMQTQPGVSTLQLKVAKNFLEVQQERHSEWLFGGLAELIHNSYDHGNATLLEIDAFEDENHKDEKGMPEQVLEVRDNGQGMPEQVVSEQLFSFGKDYDLSKREQGSGIGQYGVGFKQGSMRVASTVVALSKHAKSNTISIGIICNRPYEEHEEMFEFQHATLCSKTFRPTGVSADKYEKVAACIAKWSFLQRERIALEVEKRWPGKKQSGTSVFLQHWRVGADKMEIDRANHDIVLKDTLTNRPFRQRMRNGNIEENQRVDIDCSLRALFKVMVS